MRRNFTLSATFCFLGIQVDGLSLQKQIGSAFNEVRMDEQEANHYVVALRIAAHFNVS